LFTKSKAVVQYTLVNHFTFFNILTITFCFLIRGQTIEQQYVRVCVCQNRYDSIWIGHKCVRQFVREPGHKLHRLH